MVNQLKEETVQNNEGSTMTLDSLIETHAIFVNWKEGRIQTKEGNILLSMSDNIEFRYDVKVTHRRLQKLMDEATGISMELQEILEDQEKLKGIKELKGINYLDQLENRRHEISKKIQREALIVRPVMNEELIYRHWFDIIERFPGMQVTVDMEKYEAILAR